MNINLLRYRQNAGMGQAEVANALDISKMQVNLYEQAPDTVPMGLLVKWLQILGIDLATAMSAPIPSLKGIDPGTPYTEIYRKLNLLNQYIDATPPVDVDKLDIPTSPATPHDLQQQIKLYQQKPNVVLTGGFDAGKSHMANALLGSKNLPVGYQPATRVITFVRHIQDRPKWCKEDVLIVNEDFWLKDEKGKQIIDLLLLDDQERCEKYCVHAGSFETLQKYGVHGEYEDIAAHAAVVYINSPLLQACNLIDLPGFSDQPDEASKDAEKANSAAKIADVVLYASPAKGHINAQDMRRISNLLDSLPPRENECSNFPTLGNLLIVATHADTSISEHQLKEIPYKAAQRLYKQLNEGIFKERRDLTNRAITQEDLQTRFFTFWSERPDRCQQLFDDFTKLLSEYLPQAHLCRVEREINAMRNDNTEKYAKQIEAYQRTLADIDSRRKQLQVLEENEETRKQDTKHKRNKVYQRIHEFQKDSITLFQRYREQLLTVDAVEDIIRNQYDDKKEAKESIFGYLVEKLQHEIKQIIKIKSEKLTSEVEDFLGSYQEALLKLPNLDISMEIPFDAKGAFLGGLTGLTSIGALSAWAAALGNLGGYILVAKLVSLLSALGISIGGGTAAVISFVAAIGGPIVLGLGLAAALAFSIWNLFGESWQKRLAKETIKYFQEQRVIDKFIDGIDQFWQQDTTNTFEVGANAVEAKWNKYIEHLREITSPTTESKDRIEEIIKILEAGKDFFGGIPWSNTNLKDCIGISG